MRYRLMAALVLSWAAGTRTAAAQDPDRERQDTEDRPRRRDHDRWTMPRSDRLYWKMRGAERLRWKIGRPDRIRWQIGRGDQLRWRVGRPDQLRWRIRSPQRLQWRLGGPERLSWSGPRLGGFRGRMPYLEGRPRWRADWRGPELRGRNEFRWNGLERFPGPGGWRSRHAGRYLTI